MPFWSRIATGVVLTLALIGFAGFKAYSEKLGPLVQEHGTTFYNGEGPAQAPVACKPKSEILTAIGQVRAKFDYLTGADLKAFEQRAAARKGLPPLNVEELYIITEDEKLRDGQMVLFIGLKMDCVATVFGFPTRVYHDLVGKAGAT